MIEGYQPHAYIQHPNKEVDVALKYKLEVPLSLIFGKDSEFSIKQKLIILYANGLASGVSNEKLNELLGCSNVASIRSRIDSLSRIYSGTSEAGHRLYNYKIKSLEMEESFLEKLGDIDKKNVWCADEKEFKKKKNNPLNFRKRNLTICPDIVFKPSYVKGLKQKSLVDFFHRVSECNHPESFIFWCGKDFFQRLKSSSVHKDIHFKYRDTFLLMVLCRGLMKYNKEVKIPLPFVKNAITRIIEGKHEFKIDDTTRSKLLNFAKKFVDEAEEGDLLISKMEKYYSDCADKNKVVELEDLMEEEHPEEEANEIYNWFE